MSTERLLRIEDVASMTGLSRSTIYTKMKADDFPRPVRTGKQRVCWKLSKIVDWIDSLPEADPNDWHSPNRQ